MKGLADGIGQPLFLATWTLTDEGTRLLSVIDLGSKVESPSLC